MFPSIRNKGFTLIELLVVIAIIGILGSVVMASLNGARVKARHSARLADMDAVVKALELYASDHNGQYPPTPGVAGACGTTNTCLGDMTALTTGRYIGDMPSDPSYEGTASNYRYCADSDYRKYIILMRDEAANNWCRPQTATEPNTSWCASWATTYPSC